MKIANAIWLMILCGCVLSGCRETTSTLFTRLPASQTGIDFRNLLKENNELFNVTSYPYFYNGGGVAVGDINNDGLPDLCFTGNMVKNRLYLNKGNFQFEDITPTAHIADKQGWCTGVTMVDINNDGWLDIYICRSGFSNADYRRNLLFINNHDNTFTEQAAAYGLDDPGYSTQASFFDYDKDGDLDMFLINHSSPEFSRGNTNYLELKGQRGDSILENKLYRNDNGHFHNVSYAAGIRSDKMTFSLGVVTSDIDMDGWPDVYVTNDFKEPDYLYINNHDGTFTERLKEKMDHVSLYSMGCDIADYNNDLLPDILVPDMLPQNETAQKTHLAADNYNAYNYLFNHGMFFQYMRNTLQKNNGDGTFSEVGQLAGISNTDWSWAPLIADYDNDGWKDFFITNGYKRDNTNAQFIMYSLDQSAKLQHGGQLNIPEYISKMPAIALPDYLFQNLGNGRFENKAKAWGMDQDNLSNGAVYADLDNDGDLDLIVNRMDEEAGVYRNNGAGNHSLRIRLQGSLDNKEAIGAKVFLYAGEKTMYLEEQPVRGFQSSVDPVLLAGLGKLTRVDSIRVIWPDDKTQLLRNVAADRPLLLDISHADGLSEPARKEPAYFTPNDGLITYADADSAENDFNRQSLLLHSYAHNGPCMDTADVNGDGLTDLVIGGTGKDGNTLFLQTPGQKFDAKKLTASPHGTRDMIFFDANGDGHPDIYLLDDGYHDDTAVDQLLLNDGKGNFRLAHDALPAATGNRSCVRAADLDGDGDLDLFVGGSVLYGHWPEFCPSRIYLNNGKGKFTDASEKFGGALNALGLVTDARWADLNGDRIPDLIVCGEWTSPAIFINHKNSLQRLPDVVGQQGWWNSILAGDFDNDGDTDLVLGNYGLNTQLRASVSRPVKLYATDIDRNGSIDPIVTYYNNNVSYPFFGMDDLLGQVPSLRKKFYDYDRYASATIRDVLPNSSKYLSCQTMLTTYFENTPKGFVPHALPIEMQYSPVQKLMAGDVNKDGFMDIIAFGNDSYSRIKLGRYDANHGMVFMGNGKGHFTYVSQAVSGLSVRGDVRSAARIRKNLVIGVNNATVRVYKGPISW